MRGLFLPLLLAMLAGCAAKLPVVQLQQVKVPVPVACQEPIPDRPVMPTETLLPTVTLDAFAQAALAEIERREGYEQQLLSGLRACTVPITNDGINAGMNKPNTSKTRMDTGLWPPINN